MKAKMITAADHAEWLRNRADGIGSSEIATLMGVNKWQTPYQLWAEKRAARAAVLSGEERTPEKESTLMKMGHILEPVVANLWAEQTQREIYDWSAAEYMYIHPEYDYMRASPDREFAPVGNEQGGILECKTTQFAVDADSLPEYWFCQVQWQMLIASQEYCNIAWLTRGTDFGFVGVHFDSEFGKLLMERAAEFWADCIIGGKEPEMTSAADVVLKYAHDNGETIHADSTLYSDYLTLQSLTAERAEIDRQIDEIKDRAKIAMGGAGRMEYNGSALYTWKSGKPRAKFDTKSFAAEHPDLYEQYTSEAAASRTFLIK